jgi:hypothetical protein
MAHGRNASDPAGLPRLLRALRGRSVFIDSRTVALWLSRASGGTQGCLVRKTNIFVPDFFFNLRQSALSADI